MIQVSVLAVLAEAIDPLGLDSVGIDRAMRCVCSRARWAGDVLTPIHNWPSDNRFPGSGPVSAASFRSRPGALQSDSRSSGLLRLL